MSLSERCQNGDPIGSTVEVILADVDDNPYNDAADKARIKRQSQGTKRAEQALRGWFAVAEGLVYDETTIVVLSTIYQLVTWPTLEIAIPHIPFFLAVSPGQVIIVAILSAIIALHVSLIARYWRLEEQAGTTEGAVGG